jgi:eukaryotic translation initiation factor 2C
MVTNLAKMTWERLTLFVQKNKLLPKRVLVYRDGVSEVMTTEYTPESY